MGEGIGWKQDGVGERIMQLWEMEEEVGEI